MMKDEEFIIRAIRERKNNKKQPIRYRKVTIGGREVPVAVYNEGGKRKQHYMKTRGVQSHDAKITSHLSENDLRKY